MARLNNNNTGGFALRDYHHAAKTFTTEPGYPKAPYHGFLFHVRLVFADTGSTSRDRTKTISVMTKSVDLPNTKYDYQVLNQYNRKRLVYTKVNYEPIRLIFHDDVANNIRDLWIEYNHYYNQDSKHSLNQYSINDVYDGPELTRRHGLDNNRPSEPFLRSIEIYSMGNHTFSKMELVNPLIDAVEFDNHNYEDGQKVLQVQLNIQYESVLYYTGTTDQIPGFGENNPENYDLNFSSLEANELALTGDPLRGLIPTQVLPEFVTDAVNIARQIDNVAGKVSNIASGQLSPQQFFAIAQEIVTNSTANIGRYIFPEARTTGASPRQQPYKEIIDNVNRITSAINVVSNGRSVAPRPVPGEVRVSRPVQTVNARQETGLIVRPKVPDGLSVTEERLFLRNFPPLLSTDPRTKQPPYL